MSIIGKILAAYQALDDRPEFQSAYKNMADAVELPVQSEIDRLDSSDASMQKQIDVLTVLLSTGLAGLNKKVDNIKLTPGPKGSPGAPGIAGTSGVSGTTVSPEITPTISQTFPSGTVPIVSTPQITPSPAPVCKQWSVVGVKASQGIAIFGQPSDSNNTKITVFYDNCTNPLPQDQLLGFTKTIVVGETISVNSYETPFVLNIAGDEEITATEITQFPAIVPVASLNINPQPLPTPGIPFA